MSQIDKIIYIPILFWFFFLFVLFYFLIFSYFLSIFLTIMKVRVYFYEMLILHNISINIIIDRWVAFNFTVTHLLYTTEKKLRNIFF